MKIAQAVTVKHYMPNIYQVECVRDGKSFATRRVEALQKGDPVFTLVASFQKEELGSEHQEAKCHLYRIQKCFCQWKNYARDVLQIHGFPGRTETKLQLEIL